MTGRFYLGYARFVVKPISRRFPDPSPRPALVAGSLPEARPRRVLLPGAFLGLALAVAGTTTPSQAIVIGQPKPVCEEKKELEGPLFVEVLNVEEGEPRYTEVRAGGTDPLVLAEGATYRVGLRLGAAAAAPAVPARYRVEGKAFLTFYAQGEGDNGLPLEREFSLNALERLRIHTRNPGRRKLFLRVSECWTGGPRYLHAPAETVVPVVVIPEERSGGISP